MRPGYIYTTAIVSGQVATLSSIRDLRNGLHILMKLIEKENAFQPEYVRGYQHLARIVIAWCDRNDPDDEPNTKAPKRGDN